MLGLPRIVEYRIYLQNRFEKLGRFRDRPSAN